jgi:hypothetical protein
MAGSSEEIKVKIKIRVNLIIKQSNEQYMNLVNSKMSNVMNSIVQNQESNVRFEANATNSMNLKDIVVTGGGSLELTQVADLQISSRAIFNIVQDSAIINDIVNQTKNQVAQSLEQDADLSASLKVAADATREKNNSGEINTIVDKIAGIINGITGREYKQDMEIEQEVKMQIDQESITDIKMSDIINNTFKTNISQSSVNNCTSSTSAGNVLDINGLHISGGSSVRSVQQSIVQQAIDCILSSTLSAAALEYLKNSSDTSADQKASLAAKASFSGDTKGSITDKESNKSFGDIIADTIKSLMSSIVIVIIVVCVIGAVLLGPTIIGMFTGKHNASSISTNPSTTDALNKAMKFIINFSK